MSRLQPILRELAKHHEFASRAQVAVLKRTELARQKLAQRSGGPAPAAARIEAAPFDEAITATWGLEKLRNEEILEVAEFVKHQRQYLELLERYKGLPEDGIDRVNASAKRVGLDTSKL